MHAHGNAIAHLATYPPRQQLLKANIPRLVNIFEKLVVCLNEYSKVPNFLQGDQRISAFIPPRNLRDVGKFVWPQTEAGRHFLVDDDILYPTDYVSTMMRYSEMISTPAVLGVHGVDFLDGYTGGVIGRRLRHFEAALSRFVEVDSLGTGTVMLVDVPTPHLTYMEDAMGFVDVRFSRFCSEKNIPRICVPRRARWLRGCEHDGPTIFSEVTTKDNASILAEVDEIRRQMEQTKRRVALPTLNTRTRVRFSISAPLYWYVRLRWSVAKRFEKKTTARQS